MSALEDFSGASLRMARSLKGLSQQELGDRVSASRQFVHQLESGLKKPTDDLLAALCEELEVTPKFLSSSVANELDADACHFRKRKATTNALVARVIAYGSLFESLIDYLSRYIDFPADKLEPLYRIAEQKMSSDGTYSRLAIEEVAEAFREQFSLGLRSPIDNVTNLLENAGVFVTSFAGVSEKVDALSFSRRYNVVLRNDAKGSACRQRFDLAHELGHILLHQGVVTGDASREAEADHFASSLLFPRSAFKVEFGRCLTPRGGLRWANMLELKLRWRVSLKAMVYRAHSLGLIDARQYRAANIHISKSGWSRNERLDDQIPLEEPSLILDSILLLKENLGVGFSEVSARIGILPSYLSELLGLPFEDESRDPLEVVSLPPVRLV